MGVAGARVLCRRFNLLNGTRDRYEIRHTGRVGKYKMKLVNTFFDLVTTSHTRSHVTIIALLYYWACIVTT